MKRTTTLFLVSICALSASSGPHAQQPSSSPVALLPTNHPRVPGDLSQLWLVPQGGPPARTPAVQEFAAAVKLEVAGNFAKALPSLSRPAVRQGPLGRYADYYKGVAEIRLDRPEDARRTFRALRESEPVGYLAEAAAVREAESAEALGDHAAAVEIYDRLTSTKTTAPDLMLMRLGRAATAAGDRAKALRAFWSLYFDLPLSDFALSAGVELDSPIVPGSARYQAQFDRAGRLFTARRYEQARTEFDNLRKVAQGDDRELADLRVAECDVFLKRPRPARDVLRPYAERASRQAEALYFYAVTLRDLGNPADFIKTAQRVADEFGVDPWAEEALNSLANYETVHDNDERADQLLREMYGRFPTGRYAERAAWRIGWWAQRNGRHADAARIFEKASFDFPRSDFRPGWLYWAGRAHDALNETTIANARYTLAVTDYLNTYHGRLALERLTARGLRSPDRRRLVAELRPAAGAGSVDASPAPVVLPPNTQVIRALLDLELYDQAIDELKYAQKVWSDSSAIQATLAWISVQQGRSATGTEQFNLLRGAINGMKRAYPQHLAAGGEELPAEILKVIFPMAYWDLIRKYATEYEIDPFVAAALIAQESTFVADIKSYANAVGLTQLMPATARQVAKTLKLPYSSRLLTNPEANIQIGMTYFSAKLKEFGELHLALASYNAGETPVRRWVRERPGLERDEFIDDIPYPQTQGYVKKILATAEDYRHLYGPDPSHPGTAAEATPAASTKKVATAPKVTATPAAKKASAVSPSAAKKKKARKTA